MYIKEFKRRIIQLEEIINKIEKELPRFPQGNLRIQAKQGYPQYFHVTDNGNAHGTYITVDNKKLAEKLAQKNYYEKLLKEAKREYKAISSYLKGMNGNRLPILKVHISQRNAFIQQTKEIWCEVKPRLG